MLYHIPTTLLFRFLPRPPTHSHSTTLSHSNLHHNLSSHSMTHSTTHSTHSPPRPPAPLRYALTDNARNVGRSYRVLENRLAKAQEGLTKASNDNKTAQNDINEWRRANMIQKGHVRATRAELREAEAAAEATILHNEQMQRDKERMEAKLEKLKHHAALEDKAKREQWQDLSNEIAAGFDPVMMKDLAMQSALEERKLKQRFNRQTWKLSVEESVTQNRKNLHQSYKDTFESIKGQMGVSNLEEFVTKYQGIEDENYTLVNYINSVEEDISILKSDLREEEAHVRELRRGHEEENERRNAILTTVERQHAEQEKKIVHYKGLAVSYAATSDLFEEKIFAILDCLEIDVDGRGDTASSMTGRQGTGWGRGGDPLRIALDTPKSGGLGQGSPGMDMMVIAESAMYRTRSVDKEDPTNGLGSEDGKTAEGKTTEEGKEAGGGEEEEEDDGYDEDGFEDEEGDEEGDGGGEEKEGKNEAKGGDDEGKEGKAGEGNDEGKQGGIGDGNSDTGDNDTDATAVVDAAAAVAAVAEKGPSWGMRPVSSGSARGNMGSRPTSRASASSHNIRVHPQIMTHLGLIEQKTEEILHDFVQVRRAQCPPPPIPRA